MDYNFMKAYGSKYLFMHGKEHPVTADKWPPYVQINVARTAYNSGRHFGPWPGTARMCGLF